MDTGLIVFLSIFGIIILSIAGYFLLRYLKGSLKIILLKTNFSSSERITGQVQLKAKKRINSNRLFASIVGYEEVSSYSNGKRSTRTNEIYRFEQDLEQERTYSSGFRNTYSLDLPFPNNSSSNLNIPSTGNDTMDKILKGAISLASSNRKIYWKIEVRLDADGVDLFSSKKIFLDFSHIEQENSQNSESFVQAQ